MGQTRNLQNKLDMIIAPRCGESGGWWRAHDYPAYGPHGQQEEHWSEEDWQQATRIFEDRIRGRFLNVIDAIKCQRGSGFAVMALDCLLVETLEQFRQGVPSTRSRSGSGGYIANFLTQTSFQESFGTDTSRSGLARTFADHIRNGILHQAETKKKSRIIRGKTRLVAWIDDGHKAIAVNRDEFHKQLLKEFGDYLERLRKPQTSEDRDLRHKFKVKMDYVCRFLSAEDEDN